MGCVKFVMYLILATCLCSVMLDAFGTVTLFALVCSGIATLLLIYGILVLDAIA